MLNAFPDFIATISKFSPRILSASHTAIKRRISFLSDFDYSVYEHRDFIFSQIEPIFTLILTIHDSNLDYTRQSLNSVFAQSYLNTEVIIVSHGATGPTLDLLINYFLENKNSKLILVTNNQYSPFDGDFNNAVVNLWNAALFCSVGNFVYFMSYDDLISINYVERMILLFIANPSCVTASPNILSINEDGILNAKTNELLASRNKRRRYTNGVVLAWDFMKGGDLILFPGGLLAHNSDLVLELGGFDICSDHSQIFKFAICGDSGFDPEASLFWRHHSQQTNKLLKQIGAVHFATYSTFPIDYSIFNLHTKFGGTVFAREFSNYFKKLTYQSAIDSFRDSYRLYGFVSGFNAFKRLIDECPFDLVLKALPYLIIDFLACVYQSLPESLKRTYRRLKNLFFLLLSK